MPGTVRKTLEQGRAEFAYRCVEQVLNLSNTSIVNKWFESKLDKSFKKNKIDFKNNAIYKEFLSNPRERIEQFSKELEGLARENSEFDKEKFDDRLKQKIIDYYNEYNKKYGKEYKSYAKKIPMLIKNNGLGATLAFIFSRAKDGNAYELLYYQIEKWLEESKWKFKNPPNGDNLVAWIISLPSMDYRAITIEVLAFFNWLKRFVDGLIEGEDEGDGDDE